MSDKSSSSQDINAPEPNSNAEAQTSGYTDVDPRLLEELVCPLTKTVLTFDKEKQELVSKAAKLAFPVRDGIPIMLIDEARKI